MPAMREFIPSDMPATSKHTSKVKLWIGIGGGQKPQTWYGFLTEQNKSYESIVNRMTSRILNKRLKGEFVQAKFYENRSGRLLGTRNGKRYGETPPDTVK